MSHPTPWQYCWFVIVGAGLVLALTKLDGCDQQGERTLHPDGEPPRQEKVSWLE